MFRAPAFMENPFLNISLSLVTVRLALTESKEQAIRTRSKDRTVRLVALPTLNTTVSGGNMNATART